MTVGPVYDRRMLIGRGAETAAIDRVLAGARALIRNGIVAEPQPAVAG